jgi:hypothetical protein
MRALQRYRTTATRHVAFDRDPRRIVRPEMQTIVGEIQQAIGLLRRHL